MESKLKEGIEEIETFIDNISKDVNKLKTQEILKSNVFDFKDFNVKEYVPEEGTYFFSIEQKYLKEAMKILKVSSGPLNSNVKITLFEDRIKFSLFVQNIFSEVIVPLVDPITNLWEVESAGYPYFIFGLDTLCRISNEFGGKIDFEFVAEILILTVSSGRTKLEFSTVNEIMVDYHSKMKEITHLNCLDVEIFRDSIRYISNFVMKDSPHNSLSVAENKNGVLCGGSKGAVGIYTSSIFNGFSFKIRYENINPICKIMPFFNSDNTHIFETQSYYIIRDENVYFGFDKTCYSFPSIEKFVKAKRADDGVLIDRRTLLKSLGKLSIIDSSYKIPLNLHISGDGSGTVLELTIKDKSGKISKDSITVFREYSDTKNCGELNFLIDMDIFNKVVSHFNSDMVYLKYIKNKALLVLEENEKYNVVTNISLLKGN